MRELLLRGASWSGNERDHFFLNLAGERFVELSGVAGLDSAADGRSMALFDYDRDGWQDLAVVSANAPQLQLFRNRIGELVGNGSLTVRLHGGNRTPRPTGEWSSRDGVGARVTVTAGAKRMIRELRAGEGFAAQNSARLVIGIGEATRAESVRIDWPSGRSQVLPDVAVGSFVEAFEDPRQSPDGTGFRVVVEKRASLPGDRPGGDRPPLPLPRPDPPPALILYTSLATWCAACAREAPELQRLQGQFGPGELAILGVPTDPADTPPMVEAWARRFGVEHELLVDLEPAEIAAFEELVLAELHRPGLPATLVTDAAGRVLHAQWGPPSRSTIRRLLIQVESASPLGR